MIDPNVGIDFPSWISAICAIVATFISVVTVLKARKYYSEYALVSSDGNVLSHKGFESYGLHVNLSSVIIDDSKPETLVPEYTLEFSKVPSYFEITTREGAVVKLNQNSPLLYKLRFVNVGYGNSVVKSNFKIQAY